MRPETLIDKLDRLIDNMAPGHDLYRDFREAVRLLHIIREEMDDPDRGIERDGEIGIIFSTPTKAALDAFTTKASDQA